MAVEPSNALSAKATTAEWRMANLPGVNFPARQRACRRSVALLRRRRHLGDLPASLQCIGDEARRLHLLDEAREIFRASGAALRRAHRLLDLLERPAHHPHLRM